MRNLWLLRQMLVAVLFALVNYLGWSSLGRPSMPANVVLPLEGLSYNPYQRRQDPWSADTPDIAALNRDLALLSGRTKEIRVYRATGGFDVIPVLAMKHNLSVTLSAFLGQDFKLNRDEVNSVIAGAQSGTSIRRVLLGNETQLTKSLPLSDLRSYLQEVRRAVTVPVSTAEPWDWWLANREFASEVDFIAVHILPYWKGVSIDEAVPYVMERYKRVRDAFPGREIVIAETGWPSAGARRGRAEPSTVNQARFIRDFVVAASREGISYNIIEAFDQPWKSALEGRVGEHWGIMDSYRQEKFSLSGIVIEDTRWRGWGMASSALGFIVALAVLSRRPRISLVGAMVIAGAAQLTTTGVTLLAHSAAGEYLSLLDLTLWTLIAAGHGLIAVIFLSEAAEVGDVVGEGSGSEAKDFGVVSLTKRNTPQPFVSIHLPCCNEDPEIVRETLCSLAALQYPYFEVIVVDNNTTSTGVSERLASIVHQLGERFHFFSLGMHPGFKAGALNFALTHTHKAAKYIAVVDADYVVNPDWLSLTVPYLEGDAEISVVQGPQEHRAWKHSRFLTMTNDEFSGFFRIGMVQRNAHNAVVQHGTMTVIRKETLHLVGGWATWCICEDTELGLRILTHGKRVVYLNRAMGYGLLPATFEAFSRQRFRWVYGGMRILRRYWKELFGFRAGLSWSQRFCFLRGWLPWIGDGLHGICSLLALAWSFAIFLDPLHTNCPEPIFVYPLILLFVLRWGGTVWMYQKRVNIGVKRTLGSLLAGGSLTPTIGRAVLKGVSTSELPFYRTVRTKTLKHPLSAVRLVYREGIIAGGLLLSAAVVPVLLGVDNGDALVWVTGLLVQSFPYVAAIVCAWLSEKNVKQFGGNVG